MKTTMKLFAALTITLAFSANVFAQQFATTPASAKVTAALKVTGITPLQFGNVTPGATKSIDTYSAVAAGTPGGTTTPTAGKFTVDKAASTIVNLAFTLPTTITDGTNTMPINFDDISGAHPQLGRLNSGTNNIDFTPAAGIASSDWATTATTFDVYIGGTVIPYGAQVAGTYTGSILLTATYN